MAIFKLTERLHTPLCSVIRRPKYLHVRCPRQVTLKQWFLKIFQPHSDNTTINYCYWHYDFTNIRTFSCLCMSTCNSVEFTSGHDDNSSQPSTKVACTSDSTSLTQNRKLYRSTFAAARYTRACHNSNLSQNCSMHTYQKLTQSQHRKYSKTRVLEDVLSLKNKLLHDYLTDLKKQFEVANATLLSASVLSADARPLDVAKLHSKVSHLGPIVYRFQEYEDKKQEIDELHNMVKGIYEFAEEEEKEMMELAKIDADAAQTMLKNMEEDIISQLIPVEKADDFDIILESSAGVGGQEAMLFNRDVFHMYENYSASKGWDFQIIEYDETEIGGLRKGVASVNGEDVYRCMKFEGGVHRVQRVPKTEKSGRIHTSTCTVAILPQPTEIEVVISAKDLRVDTFRASGAGGQHVNTTESAVRIVHIPTGTVAECQVGRSQIKNKEIAMQVLRSRLFERELEEQLRKTRSQRKLQVGGGARSEKIRTYNFTQDRVTDHRIKENVYGVDSFIAGGEMLDDMVDLLQEESRKEILLEMLEEFEQKQGQAAN